MAWVEDDPSVGYLRAGAGGSSTARWISSVTSLEAFLNSLMPLPRPRANSGNFFAPNSNSTTARIRIISPPPSPNTASIGFILALLCSYLGFVSRLVFSNALLKFFDALAKTTGQARDFLCTEQE